MEALLEKEGDVENWNDDRLDELSQRMDNGFKEMREGFTRVDQEMKAGFTRVDQEMKTGFAQINREMKAGFEKAATREEVKELIASVNGRFEQVDKRFDRLGNRVDRMYYGCVALLVLLIGNSIVSAWA